MTEKLALTIAYNILCDELDRASDELEYNEEYYQEIKDAAEKLKRWLVTANHPCYLDVRHLK